MGETAHPRLWRMVAVAPLLAGVVVGACGALALVGWAADVEIFKSLIPSRLIAINPVSALCLVLAGVALLLLRREDAPAGAKHVAHVLAGIIALIGLLRFGAFVGGWSFGPDQFLFRDKLAGNVMSANSALAFMLCGVAMLIFDARTVDEIHPAQGFILAVGCIALLALSGYLYRIMPLSGVTGSKPMALNTAFCLAILSTGMLCARPRRQPITTFLDETVGGVVARRLLPAAFLVPLLLGWLRLVGEKKGFISSESGFSFLVISIIIVFNALVWWIAQVQRRVDQRRKRVEQELRNSEQRHRAVVEQASEGITLVDAQTLEIIETNQALARLLGYTPAEMVGRPISDFIVDTREGIASRAQQTLEADRPVALLRQYRRKDGTTVTVEKSTTVLELGGRRVLCTVIHDITERQRAEEELRQSEERHRAVTEQAAEGIYLVDLETKKIIDTNAAMERLIGYDRGEAVTHTVYDLVDDTPEHVDARLLRLRDSSVTLHGERTYRRKDGSPVEVEASATVITYGDRQVACTVVHDITERKLAERELAEKHHQLEEAHEQLKAAQSAMVQSEKLAGLGQMVAGVAHEINNPLAFVSNNVAVLQRDVKALSQLLKLYGQADALLEQHNAELLSEIRDLSQRMDLTYTLANLDEMLRRSRDGLRRIQQIVKDLREFARLDSGDLQEADLNAGIESTVNIVRGVAKKKQVALELDLGPLPPVTCFPAKINQVVMNLITNAIDACGEANGKVSVRTSKNGADGVRIEVADNGSGMPPEVRQRMFDPFFTTKPIGKGTGLGLSISYGIVQDHGGRIEVDSEVGKGTRFVVTLPMRANAKEKSVQPQTNADAHRQELSH